MLVTPIQMLVVDTFFVDKAGQCTNQAVLGEIIKTMVQSKQQQQTPW
jgi:hypothetical protein